MQHLKMHRNSTDLLRGSFNSKNSKDTPTNASVTRPSENTSMITEIDVKLKNYNRANKRINTIENERDRTS